MFAGGLPWSIIGIGAVIAVVVIAIDVALEKKQAKFRVPVMAFAVGVYLPFDLNVPIMLGGIVAWLVQRALAKAKASEARRGEVERMGLLAAAGFITGEALLGIGLAVPVAIKQDENAVALFDGTFADFKLPTLVFVGVALMLLYKLALRPPAKSTGAKET